MQERMLHTKHYHCNNKAYYYTILYGTVALHYYHVIPVRY
jgi:hypothetical protein